MNLFDVFKLAAIASSVLRGAAGAPILPRRIPDICATDGHCIAIGRTPGPDGINRTYTWTPNDQAAPCDLLPLDGPVNPNGSRAPFPDFCDTPFTMRNKPGGFIIEGCPGPLRAMWDGSSGATFFGNCEAVNAPTVLGKWKCGLSTMDYLCVQNRTTPN
jgi:hypothetical protein